MPNPQKIKGSTWERDVAKYLTSLYSTSFIRTPGSGAYIGGANNVKKEILHEGQIQNLKGDIVPGVGFKHLNIECKFYNSFPWHLLYSNECKLLDSWLSQALDVAEPYDLSVLFLKFNRIGSFICLPAIYESNFILQSHMIYKSKKFNEWLITGLEHFFNIEHNKNNFKKLCE